jgi:hypothetical protein
MRKEKEMKYRAMLCLVLICVLPSLSALAAMQTWVPTSAMHSADGDVTSLVSAEDNAYATLQHQETIDVAAWDGFLESGAGNLAVVFSFVAVSPTPDFEFHVSILQPDYLEDVCVIDPDGVGGTYSCNLSAYGIDTPDAVNQLQVQLEGIENPDQKKPDSSDIDYIYLVLTYDPTPLDVEVATYQDPAYSQEFRFFQRNDSIYAEATVHASDGSPCIDCTVDADFIVDDQVEQSLALSHAGNGVYRGVWDTGDTAPHGVYTIDVTAANNVGSANGQGQMHLYSGAGVSAYTLSDDHILENKHLVFAFNDGDPLSGLYQKETGVWYDLELISLSVGQGGVDSNGRGRYSSLAFDNRGEQLPSATLTSMVEAGDEPGDNELVVSYMDGSVRVHKYDGAGYSLLWETATGQEWSWDTQIGDVDGDGRRELVATQSAIHGPAQVVFFRQAGPQEWVEFARESLSSACYGVDIADYDGDGDNEVAMPETVQGAPDLLWILEYDPAQDGFSKEMVFESPSAIFKVVSGDLNHNLLPELFVSKVADNTLGVLEWDASQAAYLPIGTASMSNNIADDMDVADLNSDGVVDLMACGNGKVIDVVSFDVSSQEYQHMWTSPEALNYIQWCGAGDFNSNGRMEMAGSAGSADDALYVYEWSGTDWAFDQIWHGGDTGGTLMNGGFTGDSDNDGVDEFGVDQYITLRVYENWTGSEYQNTHSFPDGATGTVGDLDNNGLPPAGIKLDVSLPSEDSDYLVYKLYDVSSSRDLRVYSTIGGNIGGSASDDRYHLEDGSDGLLSYLDPGQWSSYTDSYYALHYDASGTGDGAAQNVIAWIRHDESLGLTFADAGLWNDGNNGGLRIGYDIASSIGPGDYVEYLLAFTQGDYHTVHRWVPSIRQGVLPAPNFMADPGIGDTTQPSLEILNPQDGGVVGGIVSIVANATDESGILSVRYRIDGEPFLPMTWDSGLYQADWDTTQQANGGHSITVVATDNANNSRIEVLGVTVNNGAPALQIAVETDKETYRKGEWVYATMTVSDDQGGPVADADATVGFCEPDGTLAHSCNGLTNGEGVFGCEYKIKRPDPKGTWTVEASADKAGFTPASATKSFEVR